MKPKQLETLISHLQMAASSIVTSQGIPALLMHLEGLPQTFAGLGDSLAQHELPSTDASRIHLSLREALLHLQRALVYAHSRLNHEHQLLRTQLIDLAAQVEWAERVRQST